MSKIISTYKGEKVRPRYDVQRCFGDATSAPEYRWVTIQEFHSERKADRYARRAARKSEDDFRVIDTLGAR